MQTYRWKGMTTAGKTVKGTAQALSEQELQADLLSRHIALLSCKQTGSQRYSLLTKPLIYRPITTYDLFLWCNHLAQLIGNGLPLLNALVLYTSHANHPKLKDITQIIIVNIKEGEKLAQSMQQFPKVFNPFITRMIDVGEQTGKLPEILTLLSTYLDQKLAREQALKKALFLPMLTLVFCMLLLLALFIFIIPQFEHLLLSMRNSLPFSTRVIFSLSTFLRTTYGSLVAFALLLSPALFSLIGHLKPLALYKDWITIKLPGVKSILVAANLSRFLHALLLSLTAGIPLCPGLKLASNVTNNVYIKTVLASIVHELEQGSSLSLALEHNGSLFFSKKLIALFWAGEQSGQLQNAVRSAHDLVTQELEQKVHTLTTTIQPLLLVLVGLIIAFVMVAVYMPIFNAAMIIQP
ncbi:MAG: type II secretion system F family protein [Epsilonproteobacteria bacterium]|nr:type II secretion system F family protein [Campylobacterota bacterium]